MACSTQGLAPIDNSSDLISVPPGFPQQTFPDDNIPTPERIALGKLLFFSKEMSRTRTVSCASCHDPNIAFTDGLATSVGVEGRVGTRNAPSLANVGYKPHFLREGGVPTLEMQVIVPAQEHNEFDLELIHTAARLATDSTLQALSQLAYKRPIDPFVITRSIASFERSLVSGYSRVDRGVLTDEESRGKMLFMSARTNCSSCHIGFMFTNNTFANTGIYQQYADPGRARLTHDIQDSAVFVVPSLRNVSVTAPYMHNGGYASLRDVIDHYNRGGFPHRNKDARIRPLGLTPLERSDLESFLKALTDEQFLTTSRALVP